MYENYTNRVKNFIIDMINPETKVIVNDEEKYREELNKKEINKNIFVQKKPFIFKFYTNEKERIIENIKNNQFLNGMFDYNEINKIKKMKGENSEIKLFKTILKRNRQKDISPLSKINISKHFRSMDNTINLSQGNNTSFLINKSLPNKSKGKINLKQIFNSSNNNKAIIKRINSLSKENNNCSYTQYHNEIINNFDKKFEHNNKRKSIKKTNKELFGINEYISEKKNKNQRKNDINKNIEKYDSFNSYRSKLHFKAAEEIAENETNKNNKYLFLLPNLFQKNKSKEKEDIFLNDKEDIKPISKEDDKNYITYYYKNPSEDTKKLKKYNPNIMKQLSKMAFENDDLEKLYEKENKNVDNLNKSFSKKIKIINLKNENEVEIGGEIFEKTTQFNLITKKVLQICNIYSDKGKILRKLPKFGKGKNPKNKINKYIN